MLTSYEYLQKRSKIIYWNGLNRNKKYYFLDLEKPIKFKFSYYMSILNEEGDDIFRLNWNPNFNIIIYKESKKEN